jgi:beta-glucosidase
MDIEKIIQQMTLEEKADFCSGSDFWHTQPVERLGVPAVMMSDGPSGLRKQDEQGDHLGINESIPAVCFPSSAAVASSFDTALAEKLGETLGNECRAEKLALLLGPGLNIKRSPLCGRNFEYFSEDPYLSGEMGVALVNGIQSNGVGSCIKHFAANNQETDRMVSDSVMDERTLHEIYLPAFETVVKKAKPLSVMAAYNKINGTHCSENKELLTDILRNRWGYEGMVVTDWGAVKDCAKGIAAGQDLEMPGGSGRGTNSILSAIKAGTLSEEALNAAVRNLLRFVDFTSRTENTSAVFDRDADYRVAVSVAENSAVLLKNEKGVLPLAKGCKAVFLGEFAEHPRYQGGGSSHVNSAKVSCALDHAHGVAYAQGYRTGEDTVDPALEQAAVAAAADVDVAVIFAGLPERYESEGYDRTTLAMPENQNHLIAAVAAVQPNTVVVLHNGSAVEMPWINDVQAVLELYLAGDGAGEAAVDLLYGAVNPSGKLAETFPRKLSDTPAYLSFPGERETSVYTEGVFVGYRYYDTKEADVLFPFGHGLSYTTFAYSDLRLSHSIVREGEDVQVTVTVTNTGAVSGKETVQLYVTPPKGERHRPVRELKAFAKVSLQPGESKDVQFTLDKRSFAYYEPELHDFYAESGTYQICVGASSRDLRLTGSLEWQAAQPLPVHFTAASTLKQVMTHPVGAAIIGPILQRIAAAAGGATGKKDDDASSMSMMSGIQLNTLVDFHVLTEGQLNGILGQINQA